ncbi:hypothetical protein MRX96_049888 [Rhipicephalus microplus]
MADEKINVQELRQCESDAEERARSTSQRILQGEYVIIPESSEVGSSTSWQCRAGASTSASSCDQNQPASRKREIVDCEPSTSTGKKLRLSDRIPESFVLDYETRDTCTLKLSNFTKGVSHIDVDGLCWDALEVKHMFKGTRLKCSFARYESEEKAMGAVRYLKDVELKGAPLHHRALRGQVEASHPTPRSPTGHSGLARRPGALSKSGQASRLVPHGPDRGRVA